MRVQAQACAPHYPLRRLLRRRALRRCDARAANTLKYPTRRHRVSTAPAHPRDLYRAWHLPPPTHRPRTRFPLLSPHFSPSLPCFWQAQRRSDGRFGVVPKGAPASPPKSRPRSPCQRPACCPRRRHACPSPWACHRRPCGRPRRPHAGVVAIRAQARFARVPGAEEDPQHDPRRPDDPPGAAQRRLVHHTPSPPLSHPSYPPTSPSPSSQPPPPHPWAGPHRHPPASARTCPPAGRRCTEALVWCCIVWVLHM